MIELDKQDTGRKAPIVSCDICQEPITNAAMAMVRWRRSDDTNETITDLMYCHKGKCDEKLSVERRSDPWLELEHFLMRLLLNSGMTVDRMNKAITGVEEWQRIP
jgi:hypothetical protein